MRSAHGVVCVIGVRAAGGVRVSQIVLQKLESCRAADFSRKHEAGGNR